MTSSSEKFCLKWNDFQQNIASSYQELRKDSEFSDVTLVCEEDQQIEAHRVILTACSPFFSSILKKSKHPHPMIYMRGIMAKDLVAIMDFIYYGEVNIYQEDLDRFLALAEELQLKGLSGSQKEVLDSEERPMLKEKQQTRNKPKQFISPKVETSLNDDCNSKNWNNGQLIPMDDVADMVVSSDITEENLGDKIDSMMETFNDGEIIAKCTVCQKENRGSNAKKNMRQHIETHIEGVSYPCNQCGKVSRSSSALRMHINHYHKK